jgi:hypothetical protein
VKDWLNAVGAPTAMDSPLIVDLPSERVLADARYEGEEGSRKLVLKLVEAREYVSLLGTNELGGGRFVREYQREVVRAVNVVRLHESGLLEIRIFRHRNGSQTYKQQLADLWSVLTGLLDNKDFQVVELVSAKQSLYRDRHIRASEIRFTGTLMRADSGTTFSANCMRSRSLFADKDVEAGVATLASSGSLYHDSLNLWWLEQAEGCPGSTVHMLVSGQINEFSIPQRCSRDDYEHILFQLIRLS